MKKNDKISFFHPVYIYCNYFWLITITAVFDIVFGIGWLTTLVFPCITYYLLFYKYKQISVNIFDVIWFALLFWAILSWCINDYPNKIILILKCIITEISYMTAYWIARFHNFDFVSNIIKKSYTPLIITCLIGLYCFYFLPGWYVGMIYKTMENNGADNVLEAFRLRSIFWSPYTLAYFNAITLIYEYFYIVKHKSKKIWKHYILIGLLLIVALLCMMRGPFVCNLIGFFISMLWGYKYVNKKRALKVVLVVILACSVVMTYFISKVNQESNEYLLSKISSVTDSSDDLVESRLYLNKTQKTFYFWGDGFGRYNMYADKYNPGTSKRDGEYMKILSEQGYIGMSLYILFFVIVVYKCIRNFKYLSFELCLVIMLLLCMIGANPLSTSDKHCFIFWLVLGNIAKYDNSKPLCLIRNTIIHILMNRKLNIPILTRGEK